MTTSLALDGQWRMSFASIGLYQFESKSKGEIMRSVKEKILFSLIVFIFAASAIHAEVGGKITGVVKDPQESS